MYNEREGEESLQGIDAQNATFGYAGTSAVGKQSILQGIASDWLGKEGPHSADWAIIERFIRPNLQVKGQT